MPQPPRIDILDKVHFITSYFWQGCDAPFSLLVEFSQEPRKDLWLMLFSIDLGDILKSWLRPGGARSRKSARHGKKHPFRNATLDINELMGGRARAAYGPYPGLALPGAKALFRITDQIDRINWTAAVVEGVTDVGFETLWGMISAHPELCPQMIWVDAGRVEEQVIPGIFAPSTPFGLIDYYSGNGVFGPDPFAFVSNQAELHVAFDGTVRGRSGGGVFDFRFTLRSLESGILAESSTVDLDFDESIHLTLSGTLPKGEIGSICRSVTSGSIGATDLRLLAYSKGSML